MYTEDKAKAKDFLEQFGNDFAIIELLSEIRSPNYSHSERWSMVYDIIANDYPAWRGVTTGLVYLVEDREI